MNDYLKKNSMPIIISIFSVVLFTSVVGAHEAFSNKRGNGDKMRNGVKAMKQLDITDEQKTQIKELFGHRKETAALIQSQRSEVRNLIEAGDVNTAAEIAANQARERVTTIAEKKMALEAILTAEQVEELSALRAARQLKLEERAEKRASRRESSDET